jgi:hypothetical protein
MDIPLDFIPQDTTAFLLLVEALKPTLRQIIQADPTFPHGKHARSESEVVLESFIGHMLEQDPAGHTPRWVTFDAVPPGGPRYFAVWLARRLVDFLKVNRGQRWRGLHAAWVALNGLHQDGFVKMTRKRKLSIVGDSADIFILIDGVKIARRGYSHESLAWISLEPGWQVLDIPPDRFQVTYNGDAVCLQWAPGPRRALAVGRERLLALWWGGWSRIDPVCALDYIEVVFGVVTQVAELGH